MTKSKIIFSALSLAFTAILFTACSNSNSQVDVIKSKGHDSELAHEGEHTYACPMHPEVLGKQSDKCPKCGMKLEHNDNAGVMNDNKYKMKFVTDPSIVEAGKEVTLSMTPQIIGKESEPVPLDVSHEKKIHLIVVSEDLSYFDHIHPKYQSDGSYKIKVLPKGKSYTDRAGENETRFENGGNYILFADYKPSGGNHTVDKINVNVKGKSSSSKTFSNSMLTAKTDGFDVVLTSESGNFESGSAMHLKGLITQEGKVVDPNTLENYLGAKVHMVVIGMSNKNYMHVHPEVENGSFDLHTTFDYPGIYRGWIQFQSSGKVHTSDFVFNVVQGTATKTN